MPNPLLSTLGILDEETSQETVYDLKDAKARSDINIINGKIPSAASSSNQLVDNSAMNTAIGTAVSSAYKHAGTKTVAELTSALLVAANKGNVYNMTDSGYTTADFLEGAGKPIDIGDNVGICEPTSGTFKFDLLSGLEDTSSLQPKTLDTPITVDEVQKTTVEGALGAINTLAAGCKTAIGTLSSLTTTVKTNIVAAINELVTNISKKVGWADYAKTGVHNWLNNTYKTTTLSNGVTITVFDDGTFELNGNSNAVAAFYMASESYVEADTYIFSAGLNGASSPDGSKAFLFLSIDGLNDWICNSGDTEANRTFTPSDITKPVRMGIRIESGKSFDHVKYYPLIRSVSDTNKAYTPYAMTNLQLSKDKMSWVDNAKTGVHQWLDISKYTKVGTPTITVSGHNVRVQVASEAWSGLYFTLNNLPKNTEFRFKCGIDFTSGVAGVYIKGKVTGGSSVDLKSASFTADGTFDQTFDVSNYDQITIALNCTNGTVTTGDITFENILLSLANDTSDAVTDYAMTNQQLTELVPSNASSSNKLSTVNDLLSKLSINFDWSNGFNIDTAPTGFYATDGAKVTGTTPYTLSGSMLVAFLTYTAANISQQILFDAYNGKISMRSKKWVDGGFVWDSWRTVNLS